MSERRPSWRARVGAMVLALFAGACDRSQQPPPQPPAAVTPPSSVPVADGRIRVAVTVDDLPSHGDLPPGATRLQLHERMLSVFAEHGVQAYGFINGARAADGADQTASLAAWAAAGQPLGNHTFSHPRMAEIGLQAYLGEIDRNADVLRPLVPDERVWRVFRYPYLFEGTDAATTKAVREHLAAERYRIAEVTIDFFDWAYNGPFARCSALHDDAAIAALRDHYVRHAVAMLRWSDATARGIWGRPVSHILLLHVGGFGAEMIDPLLDAYERENVEWITLDDAMADPIYADVPVADGITQGTLLDLMIDVRKAPHPPVHVQPERLLASICAAPGADTRPKP